MKHYDWIKNTFTVIACDDASKSILFDGYCGRCCEINGVPFAINSEEEFWDSVEFFRGETFEE